MASAEVQQQGQSFSQLKDASKETTEVVFDPFEQVIFPSLAQLIESSRES